MVWRLGQNHKDYDFPKLFLMITIDSIQGLFINLVFNFSSSAASYCNVVGLVDA